MKTPFWIGVVVALHVLVIGSVACFQGCGTTRVAPPPEPVMPPVVAHPAPPPRPLPPPRPVDPPTDTVEYVVKSGDTLSGIAVRYKVSANRIVELNSIADPNRLRSGQKLIIPMRPGVTVHHPAPAARSATPAAPPADGTEYIVKSGDTLSGIAVRFGTKVDALRKLNNLEGDRILIGQKLIVAGESGRQEAAPKPAPAPAAPAPASGLSATVADADQDADIMDALPPVTVGEEHEIIHVVMPNEDLDYISRLYVVPADDIIKLNQLSDGKVQVGQKLKIP